MPWLKPKDLRDGQAEIYNRSGPFLSLYDFLGVLRARGYVVKIETNPKIHGLTRVVVTGKANAISFESDTVIQTDLSQDYSMHLNVFWASLSLGIEQIFKGNA